MKKGKNAGNFLTASAKMRFQKQGNHKNVFFTVFHGLSDGGDIFFRRTRNFKYFDNITVL